MFLEKKRRSWLYGQILFYIFNLFIIPVEAEISQVQVYLTNLQTRFSLKGRNTWKSLVAYFPFVLSHKIVSLPIVPPIVTWTCYYKVRFVFRIILPSS